MQMQQGGFHPQGGMPPQGGMHPQGGMPQQLHPDQVAAMQQQQAQFHAQQQQAQFHAQQQQAQLHAQQQAEFHAQQQAQLQAQQQAHAQQQAQFSAQQQATGGQVRRKLLRFFYSTSELIYTLGLLILLLISTYMFLPCLNKCKKQNKQKNSFNAQRMEWKIVSHIFTKDIKKNKLCALMIAI